MKIEQLLVQHFYNHRQITLQGLGTFTLSPDVVLPTENDKDAVLPENAVSFQYNPKATEDDELISFIVQQTRKIRPLASADLDSYLVLGKQFLNIGKPFNIEGLGILEKNQQGLYEFRQGHYNNARLEAAPALLKEKTEDDISFAAVRPASGNKKKIIFALAGILALLVLASLAWYYLHNKKETTTTPPLETVQNTIPDTTHIKDTLLGVAKDSIRRDSVRLVSPDGYTFRVVFKETTNKAAAIARMNDLINRHHNVIMLTKDSVNFKLAEPYRLPLSDTTRIKDSLNKFYYANKGYIEVY